MKRTKSVHILGVNGFPHGSARIEKLKLIGKALANENINVTFVCHSWGRFRKNDEIPQKGKIDGVSYIYTCGRITRPENFFLRRWTNLKGRFREIIYLFSKKCDVAIVSVRSGLFLPLFYYWILAKLVNYKIFYPHHEDEETELKDVGCYLKTNLFLFKRYVWHLLDGAFPISDYLAQKIGERNFDLPLLKIPSLVDFEYFNDLRSSRDKKAGKYFMYCGSLAYFEVIEFVIEAFEKTEKNDHDLYLVVSGDKTKEDYLDKRISKSTRKQNIFRFGFLEYDELVLKYLNASALLIPLRNTIQDFARFPHKIGEYTASRNPILSTKIGDITNYFQHKKNALLANNYDVTEFSNLMNFVIKNPREAQKIGQKGYSTGKCFFDYKSYGARLVTFFENEN